jgi:hypothetical protein
MTKRKYVKPSLFVSKYKPEYCQSLRKFFDQLPYTESEETVGGKSKIVVRVTDLPLFATFAATIGVHQVTLNNWAETYPEFKEAMEFAHNKQEEILTTNCLRGFYKDGPAVFAQKNLLGWTDKLKQDTNQTGSIEVLMKKIDDENKSKDFLKD